jgi:hypothetical protein
VPLTAAGKLMLQVAGNGAFCAQEDGDACMPLSSIDALMKFAHCVNLIFGE